MSAGTAPLLLEHDGRLRTVCGDPCVGVIELKRGRESFSLPASSSRHTQDQDREGRDVDVLECQGLGEIEVGKLGQVEQSSDQVVLVSVRHRKGQVCGQQSTPGGRH